mgnify:CR=1 FL=1
MASSSELARLEGRIDRLADKVDHLTERVDLHLDNHHGRVSRLKTGGVTAISAAVIVFLVELAQRLWL